MGRAFLLLVCSLLPLGGVVADSPPPAPPQNLRLVADNGNKAPLVADDAYSVVQGQELVVPAPGVLANDSDPDGEELEVALVSGTTSGTINLNSDGSFNYIPNADFSGRDSFTYRVSDGQIFSNHATVWILVRRTGTAPWFEDSFEGPPPTGWNSKWIGNTWSKFVTFDTTDEGRTPPGGGQYSYRQWFAEAEPAKSVTAAHTNNTFTAENHGYENDTPVRLFLLAEGQGAIPTGIELNHLNHPVYSQIHYITNATQNTFQLRRYLTSTGVTNITDDGESPFHVIMERSTGRLAMYFGSGHPVPYTIGDGYDISISYWMKYHPDFDFTGANGNKQWMLDAGFTRDGYGRIYNVTVGSEVLISTNGTGGLWGQRANIGGPYHMPTGEWVKFDWYIKVSPESGDGGTEGDGIIMGWVNNTLRYNYSNIPTIKSGAFSSFHYWNQHSNNVPRGENQERYLDLFRIGPGAMVLSEQGLLP